MRCQAQVARRMIARLWTSALLATCVLAANAQETSAPRLPPAPTPTTLYPAAGIAASYASPGGSPLFAWQALYLPIQSRLLYGDVANGKPSEVLLSAQVSIRNTDPGVALEVGSARFHDADGKLVRNLLRRPLRIPPLGSHDLFLPRTEAAKAAGGNIIVEWSAERPINPPRVEALHSDIRSGHTLFFVTTAHPIQPR
ncbi:MAG: DUF3124 domain-containing protein [Gammaproteobacteria bacterium]|nr:DUF3124 domain-containing protein [Gammaproteobacteria bacterium]MBU1415616.1 DUF3124 domain-containing protein [Gammaproteobacteria bacterium]